MSAIRTQETPFVTALRSAGATHITTGTAIPYFSASISAAQQAALAANPAVQGVFVNQTFAGSPPISAADRGAALSAPALTHASPRFTSPDTPGPCGTAESPEQDPEALGVINAPAAWTQGADGAGVTVAYIAGGIDTTIDDFQRNAAYASDGHEADTPVVTSVNFSGDPAADTQGGDASIESFLDASSIGAQGNDEYDLNNFVSSSHPIGAGCDITVTGAAPGASVVGIDVFSNDYDTTTSNIVQAIDYAAGNGIKVLNESFGSNPFPDTALDATRIADDDAVADGVTVVVSSGDAGVTSTIGSPATDPNLISAGASTTFRSYRQYTNGGINASSPNANNNTWIDNNISSLSSGGFSQSGGNTVDLVAPGDLNWIDCSEGTGFVDAGCKNENGAASPILPEGGTSESAPLTSAAAADVIQAYRSTHSSDYPTPALVKQILVNTATDIAAPAEQQGAGLLNIGAAVSLAKAINSGTPGPSSGISIDTNQINITQNTGASSTSTIGLTNNGTTAVNVNLSTRALAKSFASSSGSFCLNPRTSGSVSCGGPPTANTFQIWSGVTESYQEETFTVPNTHGALSRLNFSATYPYTDQASLLHVALYSPSGAYAGYSLPQGLADYANVQVANPQAGTWTAVFFTQNANNATQGTINWEADTYTYGLGGKISPSVMTIGPGDTDTATFKATSPATPGDAAQSIVVSSSPEISSGHGSGPSSTTTIPVTVRTLVHTGSTFHGVLTGGNGRGNPAVTNTYAFSVLSGEKNIDATINIADPNSPAVAYLQDPEGNMVASSSTLSTDDSFADVVENGALTVYKDNPQKGTWTLVVDWLQPVSGDSVSMPFNGKIDFNKVSESSNLPTGTTTKLGQGDEYGPYWITVTNTSAAPQAFMLDPRTSYYSWFDLPNLNGDTDNTLPTTGNGPLYNVPADSIEIDTSVSASGPASYDFGPYPGDPDLYAEDNGGNPSYDFSNGDELSPGPWYLSPSEIGPYDTSGASAETFTADASVLTPSFDDTVDTETGDLWLAQDGTGDFNPIYLGPGDSTQIGLYITPSASVGTKVHGVINLDDLFMTNFADGQFFATGDELASIPYGYKVVAGT